MKEQPLKLEIVPSDIDISQHFGGFAEQFEYGNTLRFIAKKHIEAGNFQPIQLEINQVTLKSMGLIHQDEKTLMARLTETCIVQLANKFPSKK